MKPTRLMLWLAVVAFGLLTACSSLSRAPAETDAARRAVALRALQTAQFKCAPDRHLAIFNVGLEAAGRGLALTGEVDRAEFRSAALEAIARTGFSVADNIKLLPSADLGDRVWGVSCLSVASAREQPAHMAEMGTQILMGDAVRVWKRIVSTNGWPGWYLVQSADGYVAWLEMGTFVRCTEAELAAWRREPLIIVTALEDQVLDQPIAGAQPVSDVVVGDLAKRTGEVGDWFQVELPDGRKGFLPKKSGDDYASWKQARCPTAENIERTARMFLGRPYLWGGNSPKGLDCSGFTKLVFFLNGIDLQRNAGHQARQGREVPLSPSLEGLKRGDLLFFGRRARGDQPERIFHVGIYLGGRLFIHSSERVQINSLDPNSPIRDEHRIRTLIRVRRVLPP